MIPSPQPSPCGRGALQKVSGKNLFEVLSEDDLRALIAGHGFSVANLSYALKEEGKFFEYTMVIRTGKLDDTRRLAEDLTVNDKVLEFRITPAGD